MALLPDNVAEETFAALYQKREEWCALGEEALEDFRVRITGGAWTKAHIGKAYDAFMCKASTQTSDEFCRMYGLNVSCRRSIDKYGEDTAKEL
jgi:hypothetical protein